MILPSIASVRARRVWDSRGRPTVEAEVALATGQSARAIAPAGASRGTREAVDLRDADGPLHGFDVQRAIAAIEQTIAPALRGLDVRQQDCIDAKLAALDGTAQRERLGGNALVAVSMACAHAAAAWQRIPLYAWLADLGGDTASIPLPQIQIFGGGAHAGRRIDIQDLMVTAVGARSVEEALEWTARVYMAARDRLDAMGKPMAGVADEGGHWPQFVSNEEALDTLLAAIETSGLAPGSQVAIALDIAASEFGRSGQYTLGLEGRTLDTDALIELLGRWLDRYPICSIEDPLAEDDARGMRAFTAAYGTRVQIVGDDYLVTRAALIESAASERACNAALIKPNQNGLLTDTRQALLAARRAGWATIVSARSGETEDTTVADLAIGWNARQIKVGSIARGERTAKWNALIRAEQKIGADRYAGGGWLPVSRR